MVAKREFSKTELDTIKQLWEQNHTLTDISGCVSASSKTIHKVIKHHGWRRLYASEQWLRQKHHDENLNFEEMAILANSSVDSIYHWARIYGLSTNHDARYSKQIKYRYNRRYFEHIDTEQKAYWLGVLVADGLVTSNYIRLALTRDDKDHLYKFASALESDLPIFDFQTTLKETGKTYQMSHLQIGSVHMVRDLSALNVLPNKSTREIFPSNVPSHLVKHVIRGIFDGDGCFSYGFRNRDKRELFVHMSIVGSYDLLRYIADAIKQHFGYDITIHSKGKIFCIRINNTKATAVMEWLYDDATVFLDRKRQKLEDYFIIRKAMYD